MITEYSNAFLYLVNQWHTVIPKDLLTLPCDDIDHAITVVKAATPNFLKQLSNNFLEFGNTFTENRKLRYLSDEHEENNYVQEYRRVHKMKPEYICSLVDSPTYNLLMAVLDRKDGAGSIKSYVFGMLFIASQKSAYQCLSIYAQITKSRHGEARRPIWETLIKINDKVRSQLKEEYVTV
jgi:hypothetical protein